MRHILERRTSKGTLAGLGLLGAILGAAATYYLYATKDGARRRAKIARFARELTDDTIEKAGDLKDRAMDMYDDVSERFSSKVDEVNEVAAEVKKVMKK